MFEAQWKRLDRMNEQTFYLITLEKGNTVPPTYKFKVSGSTANIYTITMNIEYRKMNHLLNCDCPDATSHAKEAGVKCKHCCFIWFKVLKQELLALGKREITQSQLINLRTVCQNLTIANSLTNRKLQEKYLKIISATEPTDENKEKFKVTRTIDKDQGCPICFEDLSEKVTDVL